MATIRHIQCQVDDIVAHGEQTYSVVLRPDKRLPRFKPGQFCHLALDPYDPSDFWPESRVFSIASSPEQREWLKLTYSVKGAYTQRMERDLTWGKTVWIKLPYGNFIIDGENDTALLAGGTGITAFTAFLERVSENGFPRKMWVAYGARTADLLIYKQAVEEAVNAAEKAEAWLCSETGFYSENKPRDKTKIHLQDGALDVSFIAMILAEAPQAHFYIAGPPAMIAFFSGALRDKKILETSIHIDAWE